MVYVSYLLSTVGIAYDTINKDLGTETKTEGLHNGPPGFEFIIFPSVYNSLNFALQVSSTCICDYLCVWQEWTCS